LAAGFDQRDILLCQAGPLSQLSLRQAGLDSGSPRVLAKNLPQIAVESLAVLADGRLASGAADGTIRLWLVDEEKLIAALCLRAGRNLSKDEWARYMAPRLPGSRAAGNTPQTGGRLIHNFSDRSVRHHRSGAILSRSANMLAHCHSPGAKSD
jgi:WD40 repeat protein